MEEGTEIIVSETALQNILQYYKESSENAQQIQAVITLLKDRGTKSQVLRLSDAKRPIWHHQLDSEHSLYFTIGQGADCSEVRIAFFGPPLSNVPSSYKELLYLVGEAPYYALPDEVMLEDIGEVLQYPPLPTRRFSSSTILETYLRPNEEDISEAINTWDEDIDDLHGRPFRILRDIRPAEKLPIRLSPQQNQLLRAKRPLFVQGVAGSGKTTILTYLAHHELIRTNNQARILIIAYTEPLKGFMELLLKSLDTLEPVDFSRVDIYSWRNLCDFLAAEAKLAPFQWLDEKSNLKFDIQAHMAVGQKKGSFSMAELQEFIRAIIKGNSIKPTQPLVDLETFLEMPSMSMDQYMDRKEIYKLAEKYQLFLFKNWVVDDLDAARYLYSVCDHLPKYDYVFVDETQDYTMIQLRLLAALAKSQDGLVFVGDMNQVIYPSQFNWEKSRSAVWHVWREESPQIVSLDYNYRNPQPVSNIANILLEMRHQKLAINHFQSARSNQAMTPEPLRIVVDRDEVDHIVEELALQVGSLGIIVEQTKRLEFEGIEFQRMFTPQDVKGLEFDVVCLINFNNLYSDLVITGRTRYTPRELFLKFNEAYVSVTRTRSQLIVIDLYPEQKGLWNYPSLNEIFTTINDLEELIKIIGVRRKLRSREEWQTAALDFENQEAFASAAECWERAGLPERAASAYERAGRLAKALQIYKALNDFERAAELSQKLKNFSEAARLYEKIEKFEMAATCWTSAGNNLRAAKVFQDLAKLTGSQEHWLNAGMQYSEAKKFDEAATCFEQAGQWEKAATSWLVIDAFWQASTCYDNLGKQGQASKYRAMHYETQGDFLNAAVQWRAAGKLESAAECYEKAGAWHDAATLWLRMRYPEKAARCYEHLQDWRQAADIWVSTSNHEQAALCYERASAWNEAGEQWLQTGEFKRAAQIWERLGDFAKAAGWYERADAWRQAADIWVSINNHERAALCYERMAAWNEAGKAWETLGKLQSAMECYKKAHDWSKVAALRQKLSASANVEKRRSASVAEGRESQTKDAVSNNSVPQDRYVVDDISTGSQPFSFARIASRLRPKLDKDMLEAFWRASLPSAMLEAVARYPALRDDGFISMVEMIIADYTPKPYQFSLKQKLFWISRFEKEEIEAAREHLAAIEEARKRPSHREISPAVNTGDSSNLPGRSPTNSGSAQWLRGLLQKLARMFSFWSR